MDRPRLSLVAVVLDSPDPVALADFYARLLGWPYRSREPEWVTLADPGGGAGLSFQLETAYVPPVWPGGPDDPAMMAHLDIQVDDLDEASAWAVEQGARVAEFQPQDDVRVHLDPYGHPFCLFLHSSEGQFSEGSPPPAGS
jgi:catechol 2,3-dioxygenase-like lactoylglutathione lyase family enzyme